VTHATAWVRYAHTHVDTDMHIASIYNDHELDNMATDYNYMYRMRALL
jgi:hypothetical protein